MSSAAQFAANQTNARLSTVTEQGGMPLLSHNCSIGEAASPQNLRHGFRSQTVLLPGDDPAAYEALLADLSEYYAPTDLIELRFVREMADADWRLRRVRQHLESAIIRHMEKLAPAHPGLPAMELQSIAIETLSETGTSYGTWLRYETKFERQYDRAFKDWAKYQDLRRDNAIKEADVAMKKVVSAQSASNVQNIQAAPQPATESASNVQIARNADCPCGSRQKYKRCCGKSAPPVLGSTSQKAA